MSTAVAQELTLADVLQQLGGISPRRIRFRPAPGTATEEDVIRIRDRERRLFELVDGVLVEKVMGYWESVLAIELARLDAGYRLVWLINPRTRTVAVYTSLAKPIILTERQTLTGGDVLSGFRLQMRRLFGLLASVMGLVIKDRQERGDLP